MIEKALNYFATLVRKGEEPIIIDVHGCKYSPDSLRHIPEPEAHTLHTRSLISVAEYLKTNVDNINIIESFIHIESPFRVRVLSSLSSERRREFVVEASPIVNRFEFGEYMGQEDFVIALMTQFEDTLDKKNLLQFVGNLTDEAVTTSEDDGVTQRTAERTGIAKREEVRVPNPVRLRPFRTFAEVEQPDSLFVFRLRSGAASGTTPTMALFEADGELWQNEAMASIKEYFVTALGEHETASKITILA